MTRGEDKEPRGEEGKKKNTAHVQEEKKEGKQRGRGEVILSLPCCSAGGETEGQISVSR